MRTSEVPDPTAGEPPNARFERKFLPSAVPLEAVLAAVSLHPAAFRRTYPDRLVNNIYLDTPSLHDYEAHVSGARRRSKTRVRWYGEPGNLIERPVLERKINWAGVGGKLGYRVPSFHIGPAWLGRPLEAALSAANLPQVLRLSLRHAEPVLMNRYQRSYFESADGRFRLTVDRDLRVLAVRFRCGPAGRPLRLDGTVIEVKYAPGFADQAQAVTNRLPFRLGRYSKYVAAVERLRGR